MKNETIVDRVVERLKSQPLGDLITEEDLHEIVKSAIPKVFFAEREEFEGSGYNQRTVKKEPALVAVMRELLKESAKVAVDKWMIENADTISDHWRKVIDEGLLKYVQEIQNKQATAHVSSSILGWVQAINNERVKQGLTPIYLS